jgi:hypothetical protein
MADKEKDDVSTKVYKMMTTMAAAFVARKILTFGWTKVTGKEPPTNPEDPRVALTEALTWSLLTGVVIAAARLIATRAVARRTLSDEEREELNAAHG